MTAELSGPPIVGKVAKVLDSTGLAINRGLQDGVEVGMYFAVLASDPDVVTDPDTGESLGDLFRPKVKVRVELVEDKFCVARTFETTRVNVGGVGPNYPAISKMLQPPQYVTRRVTFAATESTWDDFDVSDSYIQSGDRVEQISPPE